MSPKLLNTLLIISSFVLYFYVVDPLYTGADGVFWNPEQNVRSLIDSRNKYDSTISNIDSIIKDAKSLEKQYNSFDDQAKKNMMIMVPDSINEIKLLSELTTIANNSGFAISDLAVKDKIGEYSINFTITTTYPKFKSFIANYEKSMRQLTLKLVSFNPTKDENEDIKFNIEMSTYYMK